MDYILDTSLAIYYIDPATSYRLSQSNLPNEIIEWRGTGEQPTERQMLDALRAHTRFTASGQTVTVKSAPDVTSIILTIGTDEYTLALTDGVGDVTIVFPPGETQYTVSAKDKVAFGDAEVTVYA